MKNREMLSETLRKFAYSSEKQRILFSGTVAEIMNCDNKKKLSKKC